MVSLLLLLLVFLMGPSDPSLSVVRAAPVRLYGVNYSIRDGPDWTTSETGRCKSYDRIVAELQTLVDEGITSRVRIFAVDDGCDTAYTVLRASQQVGGMEVWLGLWVAEDAAIFDQERTRFLELLNDPSVSLDNVIGVHVSSEAIHRKEITVDDAISLRNVIKEDLVAAGMDEIPVTVSDIIDTNLEYPKLILVDDNVVTFNQFPFWERKTNINDASSYMSERVALLEAQAGGRQIIITETGWADAGSHVQANPANPAAMRKWLRDFVCLAESKGYLYFWFASFDDDWRRINDDEPDGVEGHFGIFDIDMNLKPHIANLDIDCSLPAEMIDVNGETEAPESVPSTVPEVTKRPTEFPTAAPVLVTKTPVSESTEFSTDVPTRSETTSSDPVSTTSEPPISTSTSGPAAGTTEETGMPTTAPTLDPIEGIMPTAIPMTSPVVEPSTERPTIVTGTPVSAVKTTVMPMSVPSFAPSTSLSSVSPSASPFLPANRPTVAPIITPPMTISSTISSGTSTTTITVGNTMMGMLGVALMML